VGESPFDCMDKMRDAVGSDADLQILTRSVSGVTLTTQGLPALELQAKLMKKHGTTWDRNFDYMNDVDNLEKTGRPIVDAGMHHQVCVALMGLPFASTEVHTPEFYIDVIRRLLERDVRIDSVCMKDASGTTDPKTVYETAKGIRALLPAEMPLWMHTHDTASMAIACYMAALEGGADGIDLSVRPLASGTVQPDVRSMWHALKGTGYSLDIDHEKMNEIENLLQESLIEYDFDPVTTTPDARVVGFPMPGGAIGPNVHMMKEAGILDRYSEVLAEFPVVVKAAGAWTSVTPGSQQYWLQAFNNVLHGRWKKMDAGFGKAVLGYFGKPPLAPDAEVVKIAAEQLKLEPFSGDPLEAAPDSVAQAKEALTERNLSDTDENIFLVAASIVPGRNMDLNEGIRLLTGNPRITLPLKVKEVDKDQAAGQTAAFTERITTSCTIEENGRTRTFNVVIDPPKKMNPAKKTSSSSGETVPVYSPFEGKVEVVEIRVKAGDSVRKGQVVAAVEAMKAKHDVKAPCDGQVQSIEATLGATVSRGMAILTLTH
jgi:pyruvate carboxylase subunit B